MDRPHDALQSAPVYSSLQRRPTMVGLPQDAFMMLMLIIVALGIASRLDPKVLAGCVVAYMVLLPLLRRVFEKEPFFMTIVPKSFRYRAHYLRQEKEITALWRDRVK